MTGLPRKPLLSTGGVLLTSTLTTLIYQPPAGAGNVLACITGITLSVGAAGDSVTLYRVAPGGSASAANAFMNAAALAANKTYHLPGLEYYLPQGWQLQGGAATGGRVALQLEGWEQI